MKVFQNQPQIAYRRLQGKSIPAVFFLCRDGAENIEKLTIFGGYSILWATMTTEKGTVEMIKAIVFDLDGTLLDTVPDIAAALNRALSACGLPTHAQKTVETFLGGGIRDAVMKATPEGTSQEMLERVLNLYRDDYVEHCTEKTTLYDGVREMVDEFVARGLTMAGLSNKTENTARKIVAHFFPNGEFRAVFGRVPERPLKPHPDAAKPILDVLRFAPEEIAYVGDSNTDILFAKAVGMLPVATPWGYRSREELVVAGAERIAETPLDLLTLL